MRVFHEDQIRSAFCFEKDFDTLITLQQQAFMDFSEGLYTIPLPLQLAFEEAGGEYHVKAGYKGHDETCVIKIAGGFYKNAALGLPPIDGVIVVACQKTGVIRAILHDKGWLTHVRTALAALISAELTPWEMTRIGIIGTGKVAQLLHTLIKSRYRQANVRLWGRNLERAHRIASHGTTVDTHINHLLAESDIVISATASREILIKNAHIQNKMHIIALGTDSIHKQECDPLLFQRANTIIVDSKDQTRVFGDRAHALKQGFAKDSDTYELGHVLKSPNVLKDAELIITDLTGIAAQDQAISQFVLQRLASHTEEKR